MASQSPEKTCARTTSEPNPQSGLTRNPAIRTQVTCTFGIEIQCSGASVLVLQLRGPHLSTWPWCRRRSSMALTAAASPRSLPQSSTGAHCDPRRFQVRWRFRDERGSLAGCAAANSPAVPALRLVVSSLLSRHWPCPRSLQASAGFNVPDATLVGRFSGDTHWPVSGDR